MSRSYWLSIAWFIGALSFAAAVGAGGFWAMIQSGLVLPGVAGYVLVGASLAYLSGGSRRRRLDVAIICGALWPFFIWTNIVLKVAVRIAGEDKPATNS